MNIYIYLSIIRETAKNASASTFIKDLKFFIVDAILLSDILSAVKRRTLFVYTQVSSPPSAHGILLIVKWCLTVLSLRITQINLKYQNYKETMNKYNVKNKF